MKLIHKLLIAPAVAIVLMLVLGLTDMLSLQSVGQEVSILASDHMVKVRQAKQFETDLLTVHAAYYRLFTSLAGEADATKAKAESAELGKAIGVLEVSVKQFSVSSDDEKNSIEIILASLKKYRTASSDAIEYGVVDPNIGLGSMFNADEAFQSISKIVGTIVQQQEMAAQESVAKVMSMQASMRVRGLSLMIVSLLLALGVAIWQGRSLARRIWRVVYSARIMASGDLTVEVPQDGHDEIRQLGDALKQMQSGLRDIVTRIGHGANQLTDSSNALSDTSSRLSQGVDAQTEALQSTAAAVEEMTVSIGLVSDRSEGLRGTAKRTASIANQERHQMTETVAELQAAASRVKETLVSMNALTAASEEISHITLIIREVADQTNLLALNAAIEAARAGEQGRGFAVVADEVRKLAEKTGNATNQIRATIEAIQQHSSAASTAMHDAADQVVRGVAHVESLGGPLTELDEQAGDALSGITELTEATREQTSTCTQIAQNMERVAQMGDENRSAAQISAKAASSLGMLADDLQVAVKQFRC